MAFRINSSLVIRLFVFEMFSVYFSFLDEEGFPGLPQIYVFLERMVQTCLINSVVRNEGG